MLDVVIIGASGYTGSELVKKLTKHEKVNIQGLYVSEDSLDADKKISELYPSLQGVTDLTLTPLLPDDVESIAAECDVVFFATDAKVSHDLAPIFLENKSYVFDLSDAYRINDMDFYKDKYGFDDELHEALLDKAVYGISEWCDISSLQSTRLISVPSSFATAAHLAMRPLLDANLLDLSYRPSINAIAGASILGRSSSHSNSFCEISLKSYDLFKHQDLIELKHHLDENIIFNPHIANIKRGILTTITAKLKDNLDYDKVYEIFTEAYRACPLVRIQDIPPSIADVEYTPFSAISFDIDDEGYIVITCAIDNLLKGGASHAIQLMNLYFNLDETQSLI